MYICNRFNWFGNLYGAARRLVVVVVIVGASTNAGAESRTLSWDDKSSVEAGFVIERKEGAAGAWNIVGHVGANLLQFVDNGLVAGKTYFWRVRAYNIAGMSGPSNEATAVIPADVSATPLPAVPTTAAAK